MICGPGSFTVRLVNAAWKPEELAVTIKFPVAEPAVTRVLAVPSEAVVPDPGLTCAPPVAANVTVWLGTGLPC